MKDKKWENVHLYQYTTFKALEGIIVNKELWLCNVASMNDKEEMKHYMNCLKRAVKERAVEERVTEKNEVENLFRRQMNRLKKMPVFSSSFSRKYDDAAQWERYAAQGKGVCIEFSASGLKQLLDDKMMLQEVFYTKNVKSNENEHVELIVRSFRERTLGLNSSIDRIFNNAWACSSAYKHISFESEDEIRIMTLPFSNAKLEKDLDYLVLDGGIREYYKMKLVNSEGFFPEDLIKSVTLGPRSTIDEDICSRFLKTKGLISKIEIKKTECSLR